MLFKYGVHSLNCCQNWYLDNNLLYFMNSKAVIILPISIWITITYTQYIIPIILTVLGAQTIQEYHAKWLPLGTPNSQRSASVYSPIKCVTWLISQSMYDGCKREWTECTTSFDLRNDTYLYKFIHAKSFVVTNTWKMKRRISIVYYPVHSLLQGLQCQS